MQHSSHSGSASGQAASAPEAGATDASPEMPREAQRQAATSDDGTVDGAVVRGPTAPQARAAAPRSREQVLISATPFETRLAVMAQGVLQELHVTPSGSDSHVGTIALGKVLRVLPGMQAAFVELGLERPGFLHARDIERPLVAQDGTTVDAPDIRKLVHEGQVLPVQVTKDPIASKGARLTTNLAVPSRFLVLTPDSAHIGISQRISADEERDRLRELVVECALEVGLPADHGFIVRTAAEGAGRDDVLADMQALLAAWRAIERARPGASTGDALFRDLPTHIRVLRDLVGGHTSQICVDDVATHALVEEFAAVSLPDYQRSVELARTTRPLFEHHGVDAQISAALKPRVNLPSGGYLVVEQTEAMITVDVNTGGFTGSNSLEETVYLTNLEAAQALPRELRLRNLGGLIVVDFIDMEAAEHRDQVMHELQSGCAGDAARVRISRMSQFGLVELSRKRTRESLARQFCDPCERCNGTGLVQKPERTALDILRALGKTVVRGMTPPVVRIDVVAEEVVIERLLNEDAAHVQHCSRSLGVEVRLRADATAGAQQWEVISQTATA